MQCFAPQCNGRSCPMSALFSKLLGTPSCSSLASLAHTSKSMLAMQYAIQMFHMQATPTFILVVEAVSIPKNAIFQNIFVPKDFPLQFQKGNSLFLIQLQESFERAPTCTVLQQ